MIRVMSVHRWLLIGLVVALAPACETTPEQRVVSACSAICACEAPPLPALQDQCIARCTNDASGFSISEQCISCINANSDRCAILETVCRPSCNTNPPTDDVGLDGGL